LISEGTPTRLAAADELGEWPTIADLCSWADRNNACVSRVFQGACDPASQRVHVLDPYPGTRGPTIVLPDGTPIRGRQAIRPALHYRIGGDIAAVPTHTEAPAAAEVCINVVVNTDHTVCISLADVAATRQSLAGWSSVVLTEVKARIASAEEGAAVNVGLSTARRGTLRPGSNHKREITTVDVARCEQTAFLAAARTNAGGAEASIIPSPSQFDLELSRHRTPAGPPRPWLCFVASCPNNEIVVLDLHFRVGGGARDEADSTLI
jgi:hypothetical protein